MTDKRPPQIDLEPKDYRADPLPGEPAMQPDGLARLAVYAAWIALGLFVAALLRGPAFALSDWTLSLWR